MSGRMAPPVECPNCGRLVEPRRIDTDGFCYDYCYPDMNEDLAAFAQEVRLERERARTRREVDGG